MYIEPECDDLHRNPMFKSKKTKQKIHNVNIISVEPDSLTGKVVKYYKEIPDETSHTRLTGNKLKM